MTDIDDQTSIGDFNMETNNYLTEIANYRANVDFYASQREAQQQVDEGISQMIEMTGLQSMEVLRRIFQTKIMRSLVGYVSSSLKDPNSELSKIKARLLTEGKSLLKANGIDLDAESNSPLARAWKNANLTGADLRRIAKGDLTPLQHSVEQELREQFTKRTGMTPEEVKSQFEATYNQAKEMGVKVSKEVEDMKTKIQQEAQAVREQVGEQVEGVRQQALQARDEATRQVEDVRQQALQARDEATRQVKGVRQQVAEQVEGVRQQALQARDEATRQVEGVRQQVGEQVEGVRQQALQARDEATRQVEGVRQQVGEQVEGVRQQALQARDEAVRQGEAVSEGAQQQINDMVQTAQDNVDAIRRNATEFSKSTIFKSSGEVGEAYQQSLAGVRQGTSEIKASRQALSEQIQAAKSRAEMLTDSPKPDILNDSLYSKVTPAVSDATTIGSRALSVAKSLGGMAVETGALIGVGIAEDQIKDPDIRVPVEQATNIGAFVEQTTGKISQGLKSAYQSVKNTLFGSEEVNPVETGEVKAVQPETIQPETTTTTTTTATDSTSTLPSSDSTTTTGAAEGENVGKDMTDVGEITGEVEADTSAVDAIPGVGEIVEVGIGLAAIGASLYYGLKDLFDPPDDTPPPQPILAMPSYQAGL